MKITDTEEFIKITGILALSDVHPNDCTYITDFIINLQQRIDELISTLKGENNE